jgi:hypothetical protein
MINPVGFLVGISFYFSSCLKRTISGISFSFVAGYPMKDGVAFFVVFEWGIQKSIEFINY